MKQIMHVLSILLLSAIFLGACSPAPTLPGPAESPTQQAPELAPVITVPPVPSGPVYLNVMTHDSFAVSEDVIRAFEEANNVKLTFIKSGDSGSALNKAILSKGSPLADVFYGVDNTFLARALENGIFEPYNSPLLQDIPDEFEIDSTHSVLPVDYGDVCINYDKAYFAAKKLALPQTLQDLTKPEYKGLLVMENPAVSSPGLAFLLATIAEFGPEKYLDYWKELRQNGVVVVNDWETAYYTNFSASSGKGPQPMVVSYGSSPVAEVVFADPPVEDSPTASIVGPNTCFRQVEFAGILKGTGQRALAEKVIDFMLSAPFQEDMPLQMFVYPVNSKAKLPEVVQKFSQTPEKPASVSPKEIAAKRDQWIEAWQEAVLR